MTRSFPLTQALLLAVIFHAAVFLALTPAFQKGPHAPKIDLVFWGSILRAQDLMPGMREAEGISDVRVIAPVAYIRSTEVSAWKFGSSVEKPERAQAVVSFSDEMFPPKFMTERVVLDDAGNEDGGLDLPQAKIVTLKASSPP
jgi:hypothetical protein